MGARCARVCVTPGMTGRDTTSGRGGVGQLPCGGRRPPATLSLSLLPRLHHRDRRLAHPPPHLSLFFSFFARHFSLLRPLRAPGASRIHAPLHGKTGDTIGYHVRAIISSRNSTSPTASTPAPAKQLGKTLLLARRRILRRIPRAPSLRPSFGDTSLPPSIRNDTAQFSNLTKLSRPFQDQTTSAQDQSPARFSHALGHPIQSSQRSRGVCRLLSSMVSSDR